MMAKTAKTMMMTDIYKKTKDITKKDTYTQKLPEDEAAVEVW